VKDERSFDGGLQKTKPNQVSSSLSLSLSSPSKAKDIKSIRTYLSMELGRERNLEQNVLHHVARERSLELKLLPLERHVLESPSLRRDSTRNTSHSKLSLLDHEGKPDGSSTGVSCGPGFSGRGVGSVTVGSERLTVDEDLGEGGEGLVVGETSVSKEVR